MKTKLEDKDFIIEIINKNRRNGGVSLNIPILRNKFDKLMTKDVISKISLFSGRFTAKKEVVRENSLLLFFLFLHFLISVKKINTNVMIKKGDWFRCIKDQIESESAGAFIFKRGKIYKSILDNTITDEYGIYRLFDINRLKGYFIPYISNKRRGYGHKERKML